MVSWKSQILTIIIWVFEVGGCWGQQCITNPTVLQCPRTIPACWSGLSPRAGSEAVTEALLNPLLQNVLPACQWSQCSAEGESQDSCVNQGVRSVSFVLRTPGEFFPGCGAAAAAQLWCPGPSQGDHSQHWFHCPCCSPSSCSGWCPVQTHLCCVSDQSYWAMESCKSMPSLSRQEPALHTNLECLCKCEIRSCNISLAKAGSVCSSLISWTSHFDIKPIIITPCS